VATQEVLRKRAQLLAAIRNFFATRGVLEVETSTLSTAGATAPHLDSFLTHYQGLSAPHGQKLFLQTSPEYGMKRLLAAGTGPIYQICKAFRNGEVSKRHNPEFTMLEWYRPGFDHICLMEEVEILVGGLLVNVLTCPSERITYREAFIRYAQIDVESAPVTSLRTCALDNGISDITSLAENDRDGWLDLLLSHVVEPNLGRGCLCFVYDYPAAQAALARVRTESSGCVVAERFELYVNGIELASGYHELGDGAEQRRRFENDRLQRRIIHKQDVLLDENLLAALEAGLPDCAGVALGVDRLLMLQVGAQTINEVLSFPVNRT
jgi:lysyl-tRNA synthetase class 2